MYVRHVNKQSKMATDMTCGIQSNFYLSLCCLCVKLAVSVSTRGCVHFVSCCWVVVFSVTGSVPSMYREFYDAVCSASNDLFDRDLFVRVMSASGLSHEVLAQVFSFNVPYTVTVTEVYLYCLPPYWETQGRVHHKTISLFPDMHRLTGT